MHSVKNNDTKNLFDIDSEDDTYTYQGRAVKIITVIKDGKHSVAIVENEAGEQFEVFRDQLY